MKQILKVIIGIVILGVIGFGVYTILPEYPHNIVKSIVQPVTNARAKDLIHKVQNLPNKDVDNVMYKTILEKNTGMCSWVYDNEIEPGVEYVTFNGKGASINLKEYAEYNGKMSTSCFVKVDFKIKGNSVEIVPYIDGVKMSIDDGKHEEMNKQIRADIFTQLYKGMKAD
ncbi:MAG: hypothetical protein IJ801_06270 [Lachnospiraceae bacterium]|nr:hypothetical protein [Lachnospiraceae bacterium]